MIESVVTSVRHGFKATTLQWEQFHALLEAMPDALIAVEQGGTVVALNAQAEGMFGFTRGELLGQSVEILLPAILRNEHRLARERFGAQPHARPMGLGRNLVARRRDGSELPVDISLSPLMVGDSPLVLAALRDTAERRRAEEHIRRMNAELEAYVAARTAELQKANRQLEAYSYTVSHELRSPLRIVRGFNHMLQETLAGHTGVEVRNALQQIAEATQRMNHIVDGLLALARLDHVELQASELDMTALANSVVEELRAEAPHRQVKFTVESLPQARGDAVLLHQVFANLLSNAVKYCRDRSVPSIVVRGFKREGHTVFQVQDNGPGFDNDQAEVLFDPFQRLSATDAVEGLGIGLTLVRRIVERHAGRIWAEARHDVGATFSFSLPDSD